MKVAFSTLGCPEWSWEDMLAAAKDLGFDGIEVRGIENELQVPKAKPLLEQNIQKTRDRLQKLKLEIPCFTSSCFLFDKDNTGRHMSDARDYIDAAGKVGVPFIRVLGDENPQPSCGIDPSFVAARLSELADYTMGTGVTILIETNGYFADSSKLLELVKALDKPNVGVLWDVHHPYRYFNEPVKVTYNNLRKHIRHVHVKDSAVEDGKIRYKMMGCGDVPVSEAIRLLKDDDYAGYVSLEWVKRWSMDLEDAGIVFPHFINYMRKALK